MFYSLTKPIFGFFLICTVGVGITGFLVSEYSPILFKTNKPMVRIKIHFDNYGTAKFRKDFGNQFYSTIKIVQREKRFIENVKVVYNKSDVDFFAILYATTSPQDAIAEFKTLVADLQEKMNATAIKDKVNIWYIPANSGMMASFFPEKYLIAGVYKTEHPYISKIRTFLMTYLNIVID